MNRIEIEKRLEELKNVHYVNFHIKGDIVSCPPNNIINYAEQEYLQIPNKQIKYKDISYIDSFY